MSTVPWNRKKPEEPESQEVDPEVEARLSDLEAVVAHRAIGLLDLGFKIEQVLQLVQRTDVVHDAEALLKRGCPHEYVVDELT